VTTSKLKIDPATGKPVIDKKTGNPVPVTVNVPGYFKMRSRFVDYSGFYVIHCHILAHEDRGMMTIVEVAPARTPYSHN
jgi:FtsP/CotA-like multicopper oxidase with cupredoxin domain